MTTTTKQSVTNPLVFKTKLNLLPNGRGILTAQDVRGKIYVSMPPEAGAQGDNWSPEHLLLCAISSCFMTTYQLFSKGFEIQNLECDCIGQVQWQEGKCSFTRVELYPKVYVLQKEKQKAEQALRKTQEFCLVAHAVKCDLIYHGQILLTED
jgi:organic hydroperoxide reductase OsmC/OhrA